MEYGCGKILQQSTFYKGSSVSLVLITCEHFKQRPVPPHVGLYQTVLISLFSHCVIQFFCIYCTGLYGVFITL